jgi:prophage regulatory protein
MQRATSQTSPPTLLRRDEVEARTGLSRSTIYRLLERQCFPQKIDLVGNGRAVAWLESDITNWIADRVAESRKVGGAQ